MDAFATLSIFAEGSILEMSNNDLVLFWDNKFGQKVEFGWSNTTHSRLIPQVFNENLKCSNP